MSEEVGEISAGRSAGDGERVVSGSTVDPVVDLAVLEAFAAEVDDPATVAAVLEAYLAQLPSRRADALAAVGRGDLGAAAGIGHALGPSSAMVGARRLASLAGDLERSARAGRVDGVDGVRAVAERLSEECGAVAAALGDWRRAAPPA